MREGFPIATPGLKVGLLGGSFDPAHAGHAHISREAMRRFGLDRIWWLVSPGNPLKAHGPAPMAQRLAEARRVMPDPRVEITDIEARLGTRYTAQTLRKLVPLYPGVQFVWLMGADNLMQFDRWEDWRGILATVPVGVLARPGYRLVATQARAARVFARDRIDASHARALAESKAPAWCFVQMPMLDLSSSEIRAGGGWRGGA